jgi:hypothetical protein
MPERGVADGSQPAGAVVHGRLRIAVAGLSFADVPSSYTREEVVRNLLSYRTREVAVR